nr:PREDICTED: uncharacterized protein LOC100141600 isoform X2 [Tribolium castaneum]XP_015836554.1 PREDICTED: uncharacterized protein LOC100141600 isoform X2 [Tribolium castaneum]|eukprot:XP_001812453.2 PREDICTED: uncharacterized protein LOC100141600 isoform X2 [Tribolium castaneum]
MNTILTYLNSIQKNTNIMRIRSEFICSRHYSLSGIRDFTNSGTIYFPHLRISVEKPREQSTLGQNRRNISGNSEVFTSDELGVAREEVYPAVVEKQVDLIREKKNNRPKFRPDYWDHNYALNMNYIEYLKDSHEQLLQENTEYKKRHVETTNQNTDEIKRLKAINHDLLAKLFRAPPRSGLFLKSILENESTLKFYTGFSSRGYLLKFLDKIRTIYLSSEFHHQLNMDEQLILVLTRLRLGLQLQDLAFRCNISHVQVQKICSFWLKLLLDLFKGKPGANNRVIVQCCETFFEVTSVKNVYERTKALIEISPEGFVENASHLYAVHVNDKTIIERCEKPKVCNCEAWNKAKAARVDLQAHLQRILGCIKGFQILRGAFPTLICSLDQLDTYWRICCFLVNHLDPPYVGV